MKQNKALLILLAVAGVSVSGPMVKWSLACGASPVAIALGRMALAAALMMIPAVRRGELAAVLHAPKRQLLLACSAAESSMRPSAIATGDAPHASDHLTIGPEMLTPATASGMRRYAFFMK